MAVSTQRLLLEIQIKNQQALGNIEKDVKKLERSSLSLGKAIKVATGGFVALTAIRIGKYILNTASQFQDLRVALSAVTGSIENGRKSFQFILDFAKTSIFEVGDLTNTFIKLKGAGIEPTTELLTLFQDVASVSADRLGTLQAITDLFARTTAGGLGLEELNRLGDRGIPVFKLLENTLGLSRLEISRVGRTAEGAALILDALTYSLNTAFGGSAAQLTNNYSQAVSNLNDAFSGAADAIGKGFLPELTNLVKEASGGVDNFKAIGEAIGVQIGAGLLTASKGIKFLAENFKIFASLGLSVIFLKLGGAILRASGTVAVMSAALGNLTKNLIPFGSTLSKLLKPLAKLFGFGAVLAGSFVAVDAIMKEFDESAKKLEGTMGETNGQIDETNQKIKQMEENIKNAEGAVAIFRQRLLGLSKIGFDAALIKKFDELYEKTDLGTGIVDSLAGAFKTFSSGVGDAFASAIVDAKNFTEALGNIAKTIVKQLISSIVQLLIEVFVLDLLRIKIEEIRDAIKKESAERDKNTKATERNTKAKLINAAVSLFTGGLFGKANGGTVGYGGARAGGGPVNKNNAFLVGERGPELFVPNSAGTIVPSERLGSTTGDVNVNFNINAVDAASFDELLLSRKGIIIGTIQQAFRQQGRRFA